MPRFHRFDPYKTDKDRQLHERGQEKKKVREFHFQHPATPQEHVFAALARRKKRPVTLAPIKGG